MKSRYSMLLVLLICAALFSGCETQPPAVTNNASGSQGENVQNDSNSPDDDSGPVSIPLHSINGTSGVYIENNGMCSKLEGLPFQGGRLVNDLYSTDDGYEREVNLYPLDSPNHSVQGGTFVTLSPNEGDCLITTINDHATYTPVLELGYFGGTSEFRISEDSEVNGIKFARDSASGRLQIDSAFSAAGLDVLWIGEVPGNDYEIEDMLYSKESCSFTCGTYRGTNWIEENVAIDNPCFLMSLSDRSELAVTKTKDGYFILDTSQLSSGKYVISSGNVWVLIEIV